MPLGFLSRYFARFRANSAVATRSPPSIEEIIDALAAQQLANDRLADTLRRWASRPVRLSIFINGIDTSTMPTVHVHNDSPFDIHVVDFDKFGLETAEVSPTVLTDDETIIAIGPHPDHPGDDTWAQGIPQVGSGTTPITATQAAFGNVPELTGTVDIVLDPGAPIGARVEIPMSASE